MATISVKTKVTAPDEVTIPLVRADHHGTSNIFRISFEVFMSIFSGLLGVTMSIENPEKIHYVFLVIFGLSALTFVSLSIYYSNKSKYKQE